MSHRIGVVKISGVAEEKSDVVHNEQESDKLKILLKSASPLLFTLKILGIYNLPGRGKEPYAGKNLENSGRNVWSYLSLVVTAILWMDVVRASATFTKNDQFGSTTFMKIISLMYILTGALVQTIVLRACKSNALQFALADLSSFQVDARRIRKLSIILTVIFWAIFVSVIMDNVYQMFLFEGPAIISENLIQPFTIYFDLTTEVKIFAKIVTLIPIVLTYASVTGTLCLNLILSFIFQQEFTKLKLELKKLTSASTLDSNNSRQTVSVNGRSTSYKLILETEFETIRKNHQKLANIVDDVDRFFCLFNGCVIVGLGSCVILSLYNVVTYTDVAFVFINISYIIGTGVPLCFDTAGAILVNRAVSEQQLFFIFYYEQFIYLTTINK